MNPFIKPTSKNVYRGGKHAGKFLARNRRMDKIVLTNKVRKPA